VATENKKEAEKQQQIQQGRIPDSCCSGRDCILVISLQHMKYPSAPKTINKNKMKIVFHAYFNENINYIF